MITDAELNKLEDDFETADLLRAVDEIDKMSGYLNDRDHIRPPEIRDDLLKLAYSRGRGDRWLPSARC